MSVSMSKRERTWAAVAQQWWPHAYSIEGKDGPYAVVVACRPKTVIVYLYQKKANALNKLHWVNTKGCGGRCLCQKTEFHKLFDLKHDEPVQWPPENHGYPAGYDPDYIPRARKPLPELTAMALKAYAERESARIRQYVITSEELLAEALLNQLISRNPTGRGDE